MGRHEEPLDPGSPLFEFAAGLRALRRAAGSPTYRQLATRARYSQSVLSAAASGNSLPTLAVLRAYVKACGGDPGPWQQQWERMHRLLTATRPDLVDRDDVPSDASSSSFAVSDLERALAAIGRQRADLDAAAAADDDEPDEAVGLEPDPTTPEPPAPPLPPAPAVPAGTPAAADAGPLLMYEPGVDRGALFEPLHRGDPSRVGSYRVAARLGGGAMGEVFLASSPAGRPVAVKLVRAEYAHDAVFRSRFTKEVAAVRGVAGGHTPALIDADTDAERPWIATVYVPGPSLERVVGVGGPLPEAVVLALGGGIAEALTAIHAAGIVHRDLKPSNILLDRDGPKVIDFGISRALDGTALTATGMRVGTAGYTAPELATRGETLPAGDVFALGCILAYAATGIAPFGEGPDARVLYRIVHEPPAPDALACKDKNLRALIEACLAKDPARRPTPQQVVEACGGTPEPGESWLPSALAAQSAAHGRDAAALLARQARRRTTRRVTFGLAPLLLILAIATTAALTTSRSPNSPVQVLGPRTSGGAGTHPSSASPSTSVSPTATGAMTRQEMLDALRQLLPAGAAFSNVHTDTTDGAIEADYNDGGGAADLMVSVAPSSSLPSDQLACPADLGKDNAGIRPSGAPPISCAMRSASGGGTERVWVTPAEFGGWYTYQLILERADGTEVEIQVANGTLHTLPKPDRTAPPGTLAQWESIVESPLWHS